MQPFALKLVSFILLTESHSKEKILLWVMAMEVWPGGHLVAGGSTGLWTVLMQTPAGHFSRTLSEVGWLRGLTSQSCFNEKSPGSPTVPHPATEWTEFLPLPGF